MKKILIFSLTYTPFIGGAEVALKEITNRISEADFVFHMITLRFDKKLPRYEKVGNIHLHRVGFSGTHPTPHSLVRFPLAINKYLFPFLAFRKALFLHLKYRFDMTWVMMANYAGFAGLFFKYQFPRVPMLLTLQEGDPIPYIKARVRSVYPLFKKIFTKANYIQTISKYLADFAQDMQATSPVEVVPNGVSIKAFEKKQNHTREEIRKKFGYDEGDVVIITTGRLVLKNGVEDSIRALTFLPPHVKFLSLGIGPLEKELHAVVSELGLEKRVHFLGHIENKNIPNYLHASDIFCRPSLSEGMGNSFIEAMAAGLPVIGTNVGGIADFLFDNKTGYVCQTKNPQSIAECVHRILSNPSDALSVIKNARTYITDRYEWKAIAERMFIVFTQLTHPRS